MRKFISFLAFVLSVTFCKAQPHNNDGDTLFSSSFIHEIRLNFSQPSFWDSLTAYYTQDRYMMASIVFDGYFLDSIDVKLKGNSSYNYPSVKKSMKVGLNEFVSGKDIDDINKFNLNNCFKDPTFLREKMMLDFLNLYQYPAPRCTYARVYLNNQYWGLYTMVEEVNKDFLKGWYNFKNGNLFKGDPSGDLKWLGTNPALYYPKYELKTNETLNDWSDLVRFINVINNTPAQNFYDSLESYLNTHEFIYEWAISNLFVNLDSYLGTGHNYYIYHDSLSGKFRYITWDVNEAFGNFNYTMTPTQLKNLSAFWVSNPPTNRPLINNMLSNSFYRQKYANTLCDLLGYNFSPWALYPKIDSLANRIRPYVYADPNKFFSNQHFEDNLTNDIIVPNQPGGGNFPGLKSLISVRRAALANELASYGCILGLGENDSEEEITVFPNPGSEFFVLSPKPLYKIELTDIAGKIIMDWNPGGLTQFNINPQGISTGVYFLIFNGNKTQKVIYHID